MFYEDILGGGVTLRAPLQPTGSRHSYQDGSYRLDRESAGAEQQFGDFNHVPCVGPRFTWIRSLAAHRYLHLTVSSARRASFGAYPAGSVIGSPLQQSVGQIPPDEGLHRVIYAKKQRADLALVIPVEPDEIHRNFWEWMLCLGRRAHTGASW
jgi:hypothetical protein